MERFQKQTGVGTYSIGWLFPYHTVNAFNEAGVYGKNPLFQNDQISKYLLDLKKAENYNFKKAVNHCRSAVLNEIRENRFIAANEAATLCMVPSSRANAWSPGIASMIAQIVAAEGRFVNGARLIRRTKNIDKLADGGSREIQIHRNSLDIQVNGSLGGTYVLFDDITTSGNSMAACIELLIQYGASRVLPIALGKTV